MRAIAQDGRLEAVAGPPLAQRSTAGTTSGLVMADSSPRTVYGVATKISNPPGSVTYAEARDAANTRRVGPFISATGNQAGRCNLGGNETFGGILVGNGRHAAAVQYTPASGAALIHDDVSVRTTSFTPANQLVDRLLVIATAEVVGEFGAVYDVAHDAGTRKRVLGWLARRHQAPPPA